MKKIELPIGTAYSIGPEFQAKLDEFQEQYLSGKIPRLRFIQRMLLVAVSLIDGEASIEDNLNLHQLMATFIEVSLQFKEQGVPYKRPADAPARPEWFGVIPRTKEETELN